MTNKLSDDKYPLSNMLNLPLLSSRKTDVQLKTDDATPLSSQMNWPLLDYTLGEGRVELMTDSPTVFSSRMGWPLLSDKPTMFDTELPGSESKSSGESPFGKFMRGIMSGEVQK
ncbi:hypothetical protein RGUI_1293 [Rhodovulum sp. P5]|uniref:hypothetical protein n=1 Tax=Rhodovulum sp. P5 TaxID=1564506 RepID=UPI0009C26ACC|nr:hypothetical protein [Rhodovulum sp. P5]ARE39434.1 hypothetical protein RGUI_1293 [Rhodovulum sp. P5]